MAWVIQSAAQGPVECKDLGMMFMPNSIRDVDLIGRENAERSGDLQYLLQKGYVKELRKDAAAAKVADPVILQALTESNKQQAETIQKLGEQNTMLTQQVVEQKSQNEKVLEAIKAFGDKFPLELRTISEAMRNIKIEQQAVAGQQTGLAEDDHTAADVAAQDKVLNLKQKKLEKNLKNLASTVSKSDDIDETLAAMDELGI